MALVNHTPEFSIKEINYYLEKHYGLKGHLQTLPSERDQNWLVTTQDNLQYVLKFANKTESRLVLEMQHKAMALAREAGVPVQEVLLTHTGSDIGTSDEGYLLRLMTYLPGVPLAHYRPHTEELLNQQGEMLAHLDQALYAFDHPAAQREFQWDLRIANQVIDRHIGAIQHNHQRKFVEKVLQRSYNLDGFNTLRTSVIHNDANDYNILVEKVGLGEGRISGLLDFGDMMQSYTISELAITCAYVMLEKEDPLTAAMAVAGGYHRAFPLNEAEIESLYDLITLRLCTSVTLAAFQRSQNPENEYLSITEKPAWDLLEQLSEIHPHFAQCAFRAACGFEPDPKNPPIVNWLNKNQAQFAPIIDGDLANESVEVDLSIGSTLLSTPFELDHPSTAGKIDKTLNQHQASTGVGRYGEARFYYANQPYPDSSTQPHTIHTGLDLFKPAGSTVYAPLDGIVQSTTDPTVGNESDIGVILRHDADGSPFYTLYKNVIPKPGVEAGRQVRKGDQIAVIHADSAKDIRAPHLHFQIITDLMDLDIHFPGYGTASKMAVWKSICPDANLIAQIPGEAISTHRLEPVEIMDIRKQHIGPSLSISYEKPLKIVRGFMQYLYDETGRAFLDAVNNVPHVGHSHPLVVQAAQEQMRVLNTNTRYLHDNLVLYAQRLAATLPEPLKVCFFVNSGSEANDLALRLAKTYTGCSDIIVLDGAYHGNLSSLIDISPYKFNGAGGSGKPDHVQVMSMPDPYRCAFGWEGEKYVGHALGAVEAIQQRGKGTAAFIAEPLLGCGGQIVLPDNYLKSTYQVIRDAGGVCIADEVQVGLGRVGSHFWAFETQGVVPDIVTVGKPIGNGHPLAAVITTPEIAAAFHNGMEYFNTFGGNPVSAAIGMAVLDVIEQEGLQENARTVGAYLKTGLTGLMHKYPLIGDVRGLGLFLGVELVLDEQKNPAAAHASYIANQMKEAGVLISTDGPMHNVLKIKPPLVFNRENADELVTKLDQILNYL